MPRSLVGSFDDQMVPATFWTLDASIAIVGAALIILTRRSLERMLATPNY